MKEEHTLTLYEINSYIEKALDDAIDPETGEIVEGDLYEAYEQLLMDRDDKIENIACYIKNLRAEAAALKEEKKAFETRQRIAENKAERLSQYLEFCLKGEKFSTARCSISYRRSKKVEVDENRLNEVPEQYLRYKQPEVDKKAVTEALKAGEEVPGCTLVDSVSVIIK